MEKSHLRNIIKESIKELMTEQSHICHFFSACGETGLTGGSYPYYLDYYNAPNQGDKTIKSNDFYVAVGSPSPGSVVHVTGTNNPVWQGGQFVSHPLDTCLQYNGTYSCGGGMSSYLLTAQGTPMSSCNDCNRWDCEQKGHWSNTKCVPAGPGGQFATKQDCMMSGCEGMHDDGPYDDLTSDLGGGPISPLTTDPQDMVKPDDEISRMQDLANIRRER
jgi:hypothetical protein